MDFMKYVEEHDMDKLTKNKVTNKYVKANFDVAPREVEKITVAGQVPVNEIFMGQTMPINIFLGFVQGKLTGDNVTHIETVRAPSGPAFRLLNKETVELSEKDMIAGIKEALLDRIKGF